MQEYLPYKAICSVCLAQYEPNVIAAAYTACPECNGEALEHPVEEFGGYLGRQSNDDLEAMLVRWDAAREFGSEYKDLRRGRILALIALRQEQNRRAVISNEN